LAVIGLTHQSTGGTMSGSEKNPLCPYVLPLLAGMNLTLASFTAVIRLERAEMSNPKT